MALYSRRWAAKSPTERSDMDDVCDTQELDLDALNELLEVDG